MHTKIRIILADDHAAVRKGIGLWLERNPWAEVVATASDTESLADLVDRFPCDIVISDIGMRGINGESNAIAFLRRFLRQPERPRLIIVTMIAQPQMLAGLLDLGADALVDKRDSMESLDQAMVAAIGGNRFVSRHADALLKSHMENKPSQAGVLSAREWEVLQLYAGGLSLIGIAYRLERSIKTIGTQRRNAMRKLGLETEVQLLNYLRQIGLA